MIFIALRVWMIFQSVSPIINWMNISPEMMKVKRVIVHTPCEGLERRSVFDIPTWD